MNFWLSKKLLL